MLRPDIVITCATMGSATLIQLVFLAGFVCCREVPLKKGMIFTPFNASLGALLVSLLGMYICETLSFTLVDPSPFTFTVLMFFAATYEYCYLFYCYARGFALVVELHPKLPSILSCIFNALPVVLYIVPILTGVQCYYTGTGMEGFYTTVATAWSAGTGVLTLSIDVIILTSFVRFLHKTTVEQDVVDKRFRIISWYGIGCSAWAAMALIFYILFAIRGEHLFLVGTFIAFNGIGTGLLAMKIALFYDESKKSLTSPGKKTKVRGSTAVSGVSRTT
ncbi:hypothetical protein HDU83_008920 [Entophlyctis luteolus]|nr:hypothetical protein HDU83_008920 [Entophlyctis luteolus]